MKYRSHMLFAPADAASAGGGGSPAPSVPAQAPQAAAQNPVADPASEQNQNPPAKPGLVQQVIDGLRSKAAINAELASARAEIASLKDRNATLLAENQRFTGEMARIKEALENANGEAQTTNQAAAAILASHGVDPVALPPAAAAGADTLQTLREKLAAEKNPRRRYTLQQQISAAEEKAS